jgi:hypothetical protein
MSYPLLKVWDSDEVGLAPKVPTRLSAAHKLFHWTGGSKEHLNIKPNILQF